ncbi:MAG: CarD family transcriptional regulator [Clostridia bacterium]|nr:CarD family transcriptional regulator [Clostridia bacterium]
MYAGSGVYRIADIRQENFSGEKQLYYVLNHTENDSMTVYCPVDSTRLSMRKLLSKEEIFDIIRLMPDTEEEWIENDQERNRRFTEILRSGDHMAMVKLIKTLYAKKEERLQEKRRLHASDERMMKDAEKLLHEEFAHVLRISLEEVLPFILGEIEKL